MPNLKTPFLLSLPILSIFVLPPFLVTGQHFDAVDDKPYLERIETLLLEKVELAKQHVIREGNLANGFAEQFIRAKVKQNLFKKLRPLVEEELETLVSFRPRQSRQNNNNEEEEDGEEEETSTASGNRSAAIIPQVANLVKAIFGGNSINITSYVQGATKYLPPSISNQVLGVVKLLAHNPSDRWVTTTTSTEGPKQATTPAKLILVKRTSNDTSGSETQLGKPALSNSNSTNNGTTAGISPASVPFLVKSNPKNNNETQGTLAEGGSVTTNPISSSSTTSKPKATTEEDEEGEEEEETFRQLRIPGLNEGISALGSLFSGGGGGGGARRPSVNATTESASGFEEEATVASGVGGVDLRDLASGVRSGLGDLIKAMPDLFKGAREAVSLLSGIQSLLGSFGG